MKICGFGTCSTQQPSFSLCRQDAQLLTMSLTRVAEPREVIVKAGPELYAANEGAHCLSLMSREDLGLQRKGSTSSSAHGIEYEAVATLSENVKRFLLHLTAGHRDRESPGDAVHEAVTTASLDLPDTVAGVQRATEVADEHELDDRIS